MTTVYYTDPQVTVHHGDSLDVLKTSPDNSIDAVVTDPPYSLSFMARDWDTHATPEQFQAWCHAWATECLRMLKPGGHVLAFGGTRTFHRLAAGIEDAGFDIRDTIAWLYGSGFPKSLDVSKAIDHRANAQRPVVGVRSGNLLAVAPGQDNDRGPTTLDITAPASYPAKQWQGWGTASKPAFEPVVVARKPLAGTVAANVQAYGTGALHIDACRTDTHEGPRTQGAQKTTGATNFGGERPGGKVYDEGRWPANVLLDEHQAADLDTQSRHGTSRRSELTSKPGTIYGGGKGLPSWSGVGGYDDAGGASRFFPTFHYTPKAATSERPTADGVGHPTVKPLDLMRWLIRLVTPPHGVVLDPFAGTGTTGEAAIHEHQQAILIEREPDYLPLILNRLGKPMHVGLDFTPPPTLFDDEELNLW